MRKMIKRKIVWQLVLLVVATMAVAIPAWAATWSSIIKITNDATLDSQPSLAVDSNGKVHIAWERTKPGEASEIYYKTNKNGSWITKKITSDLYEDFHPSIAIDSKGAVHIAWYSRDYSNDGFSFRYATNKSGSWKKETISGVLSDIADADHYQDRIIAVDKNQMPHVVFRNYSAKELYYANRSGGKWNIKKLASSSYGIGAPSIALDTNNKPHVAWQSYLSAKVTIDKEIFYATNVSGSWVKKRITNSQEYNSWPSIGVTSNGKAYIAWGWKRAWDSSTSKIIIANNTSGSWSKQEVASSGWGGVNVPSLSIYNDKLYIAYSKVRSEYDLDIEDIYYGINASGSWTFKKINGILAGYDPSLVVKNGLAHVVWSSDGGNISYRKQQ